MKSQRVRILRLAVAAVLSVGLVPATRLDAQKAADRSSGPDRGTWAGEATAGNSSAGSLLYFTSGSLALRATIESFGSRRPAPAGGFPAANFSSTAALIGVRQYRRSGLGLRPVLGTGLLLGRNTQENSVGAYAEAGAVWFFTPHVSLGVIGDGRVSRGSDRQTNWGFSLARLTGAVYF